MSAATPRARCRRGPACASSATTRSSSAACGVFDTAALGFAGISPVVGLYAVVLVGTTIAGPAWIWVLPVALAGQCLLLAVYSELASEFPIAGGAYQWSRRLIGGSYGWFNGWVAVCAYAAANTTIAYLGAPWLLTLLEIEPTRHAIVVAGMALVSPARRSARSGSTSSAGWSGPGSPPRSSPRSGSRSRCCSPSATRTSRSSATRSAPRRSRAGRSLAAMLAALAVGGWVFIGFDCAVGVAEETRDAARQIPRAIWIALLSVGVLVIANAVAVTLAHPDPASVVAGGDLDPVTTSVTSSFGSWSDKPFAAIVLTAFVACGGGGAGGHRAHDLLDGPRRQPCPARAGCSRVDRRQAPIGGIARRPRSLGCLGLLLGLEATAVGSLIAFGTAAIYVSFLLVAVAALIARLRGSWRPAGRVRLGRLGLAINIAAVVWLAFETVNIAWPRSLAGAAGRALLPGVGGTAGAGADRRRRHLLPGRSPARGRSRRGSGLG